MTPRGITIDTIGNIYFCDYDNYRVRQIDTSGIVHTIAGNGVSGYGGDGGPATNAIINYLQGIYYDIDGNLYLTDVFNNRLRKINAAGVMSTVAGTGSAGYTGDGGLATAAEIHWPVSVFRYHNGNIFFSDNNNNVIRMLSVNPYFLNGQLQHSVACSGFVMSLDTLLAANDSNSGVMEHWSLLYGPYHGTASVAYNTVTTGATVYPAGLTYVPASGYTAPIPLR